MSTRCQLRFTEKGSDRVAQVYRHSDGYPESILSNLEHLQKLLHATGAQRDASYAAAQYLLVDGLWRIEQTFRSQDGQYEAYPASVMGLLDADSWQEISRTPSYLLGHGIEDPSRGIHGDEEYIYYVQLPLREPVGGRTDWTIKVSEQCGFPRWEKKGTKEAFDVADWKFEGTLEEAMTKVGEE